jgi:hypothetical protein
MPNNFGVQFGGGGPVALGGAQIFEEGNISRLVSAGINPGVINQDNVLATYTIPAGSFDQSGRGISIQASGNVANNTNSKRIRIYYNCTTAVVGSAVTGGTVIADTGAYTTALAAGWNIQANIFKYGAKGSNTQNCLHEAAQIGSTLGQLLAYQLLTATESGGIIIAITGNAVTALTDISLGLFIVNAMN